MKNEVVKSLEFQIKTLKRIARNSARNSRIVIATNVECVFYDKELNELLEKINKLSLELENKRNELKIQKEKGKQKDFQ
jgi:hypothetical protein